ncbi:hypothetical protein JRQ81_018523 [Phrynocephalus forsythii]|uniref:Uncharacterized protein n=1 Tax=Phrynocephalus forsythii TaxID=171643 RepID=A0A9Q1AYV1_9SAUR|nr:hypothetical protein JRQ81_018523 [Phrynocephalus forsythii]
MQTEESSKSQKAQQKSKEVSKKHSGSERTEQKDSHRKNSEESKKPHKPGIMKQQRSNLMSGNPNAGADKSQQKSNVDIGEVCPWEVYDQSPGAGATDPKVQKHVSIASSESEKPSQAKGQTLPKSTERHQLLNQKSTDRCEVCPWESQETHGADEEEKHLSPKTQQDVPGAKSENANKQYASGNDPKELLPKAAAQTTEKWFANKLGNQTKSMSSSPAGNALPSDSARSATSNSQKALASRVDVCPWEFDTPELPKTERSIALSNATGLSSNKTAKHQK